MTGLRRPDRQRVAFSGLRLGIALGLGLAVGLAVGLGRDSGAAWAQSAARAALDPPAGPLLESSFRAAGSDPAAPRPLVLWRFDGIRLDRLAESRSEASGRFDFGIQPLPLAGADFGVTGPGESPNPALFRRYERAVPAPVVASEERTPEGEPAALLVLTARAEGELRIRDAADDRLLARIPVEQASRSGTRIELARWLPDPAPAVIALEHRLDDGRLSPRELWPLDSAALGGP